MLPALLDADYNFLYVGVDGPKQLNKLCWTFLDKPLPERNVPLSHVIAADGAFLLSRENRIFNYRLSLACRMEFIGKKFSNFPKCNSPLSRQGKNCDKGMLCFTYFFDKRVQIAVYESKPFRKKNRIIVLMGWLLQGNQADQLLKQLISEKEFKQFVNVWSSSMAN